MSPRTRFDAQATGFADVLSDLLNRTITDGIRIRCVLRGDGFGWVGYQISKQDFAPGDLVPITISAAPPVAYLHLALMLRPDSEMRVLVVERSKIGLYGADDFESMICHYDFDRNPGNAYPLAHFQVAGDSTRMVDLCNRAGVTKALRRLHFPVGGKRYRPTLEDMIEFLVVEELAQAKPGWDTAVAEHRARWNRMQLLSVVRRDPAGAAEELRRQGYRVDPPQD